MNDFKNFHIGELIQKRVDETGIDMQRICNFFQEGEQKILAMYHEKDCDTVNLMKWSKLLSYDFFRIYSHHLILYSPPKSIGYISRKHVSSLPQFRKNIYTREIIDFILEMIYTEGKTKQEIIKEYNIPKTTLYKWISKHKK